MQPTELFRFIAQTVERIANSDEPDSEKVGTVYNLLSHLLIAISEQEKLHFTTLFARITYCAGKYALEGMLSRVLHQFRIDAEAFLNNGKSRDDITTGEIWQNGAYAVIRTASAVLHEPLPARITTLFDENIPKLPPERKRVGFVRELRMTASEMDEMRGHLIGFNEENGDRIRLAFATPGRSELYKDNVLAAAKLDGFPLTVSAVNVEIDEKGIYTPRLLVIEPDYLVDITAVAACFASAGADSRYYLLNKFLPKTITLPILTGHVANFFLDELLHNPDSDFRELMTRAFLLNPTTFSTLSDAEVLELTKKAEIHFENLRKAIVREFPSLKIDPGRSFIEPSYYAPAFGIQGRLDLYHANRGTQSADIVELKSAKPFKANAYGLSSTHYVQTLLYDLLIRAVQQFDIRPSSYILYSSQSLDPVRFAPPVESIQREAVRLRNEILLIEKRLTQEQGPDILDRIKPELFEKAQGYVAANIRRIHQTTEALSPLEKRYIKVFMRLIANEHYLAKLGIHGSDRVNGLAALWLDPLTVKDERFSILHDLRIASIDTEEDAFITLARGPRTNPLANFRTGDIAVLYPDTGEPQSVIHSQVHKCSLLEIDVESVTVRLRNKQVNYDDLRTHKKWSIEHDVLDSSFANMYRGLFSFAEFPPERRSLYLGTASPGLPDGGEVESPLPLSGDPGEVLKAILEARDYYLLWGPPGTGKTSVMLYHLVAHYVTQTQETILLMAYTNRAVDEICHAVDRLGNGIRDKYLRIGSRISTHPGYRDQLLSSRVRNFKSRRELLDMLKSQRVIVSTVSSIMGRQELFELLEIDVAIVDEASQILEPMLAGILPRFRKWVLIGDHKQLPAVVAQDESLTKQHDEFLQSIALTDTRISYFERMYRLCQERSWDWAYGRLYEQGRMHEDIMQFASATFYNNALRVLANGKRDLTAPLDIRYSRDGSPLIGALTKQRMIFIPSRTSMVAEWGKTHDHEARIVTEVVQSLEKIYGDTKKPQIGIITPFRAQIANIRDHLVRNQLDPARYTIDTVERYQGSARDIIILSLSINQDVQIDKIVSLSEDGVDRKLNVAITRAREQFILTASPEVVRGNSLYKKLIDTCHHVDLDHPG